MNGQTVHSNRFNNAAEEIADLRAQLNHQAHKLQRLMLLLAEVEGEVNLMSTQLK